MEIIKTMSLLKAGVVLACLWLGGCSSDAFVTVQVHGADAQVDHLELWLSLGDFRAVETYDGHPSELSAYLPAGALHNTLLVYVSAWHGSTLIADGNVSSPIMNRIHLDLSIALQPH
jgi:hypothetical protein